jgi:hypothetical protein
MCDYKQADHVVSRALYQDVRCSLLVTLTSIHLVLPRLQSNSRVSALTYPTKF